MDEEYDTNNNNATREEEDAKKIATSIDPLNSDIINYFSKQGKNNMDMMNEYNNFFKDKDTTEANLKTKFSGKRSVIYNNNDIFRYSNFEKIDKNILASTTYPKNKRTIYIKGRNEQTPTISEKNNETETEIKNDNDDDQKSNKVMKCVTLYDRLVHIKKGDIINKNKGSLIMNKELENSEEKKIIPRLNLLTKLVKKPRNSEYKKIVTFKANDDLENYSKLKCRHRSVKKKIPNINFGDDDYLDLKYNKSNNNELNTILDLRRTTKRHQTVASKLNIIDNLGLKEKENIKELDDSYWSNIKFERKYSGNVFPLNLNYQ